MNACYSRKGPRTGKSLSEFLNPKGGIKMKKKTSIFAAALLILAFSSVSLASTQGSPSTPSAGAVVSDVLLLRPVGFAGTILGGAAFVVSLPLTLATHKVDRAEQLLVQEPYDYTFERPLGQM
jgi:hypothetical protein